MAIKVQCEGCGAKFNAPDEYAGRSSKCIKCGETLAIPTNVKQPAKSERRPWGLIAAVAILATSTAAVSAMHIRLRREVAGLNLSAKVAELEGELKATNEALLAERTEYAGVLSQFRARLPEVIDQAVTESRQELAREFAEKMEVRISNRELAADLAQFNMGERARFRIALESLRSGEKLTPSQVRLLSQVSAVREMLLEKLVEQERQREFAELFSQ